MSDALPRAKAKQSRIREESEKNSILSRINREFGALGQVTKSFSTTNQLPKHSRRAPGNETDGLVKHTPFTPRGLRRYSKIDKFIDNLNLACEALPKPLMDDLVRCPQHLYMPSFRGRYVTEKSQDGEHISWEPHVALALEPAAPLNLAQTKSPASLGSKRTSRLVYDDERSFRVQPRKDEACTADSWFEHSTRLEMVKAATVVQSRYRGYKVRRNQPLKYMLLIGAVKSKLKELKQQFDAWTLAVWFPTDISEKLAMTENLMDLLLQLDALQGVPVYVREFRKRVAREVIEFQGKVDAFLNENKNHSALLDLVGEDGDGVRNQRQKSKSARRTAVAARESNSGRKFKSWRTVRFASLPQEERALNRNTAQQHSTGKISDSEGLIDDAQPADQSEDAVDSATATRIAQKRETQSSKSVTVEGLNVSPPVREGVTKTSRRNGYGVRFEDANCGTEQAVLKGGIAVAVPEILESDHKHQDAHSLRPRDLKGKHKQIICAASKKTRCPKSDNKPRTHREKKINRIYCVGVSNPVHDWVTRHSPNAAKIIAPDEDFGAQKLSARAGTKGNFDSRVGNLQTRPSFPRYDVSVTESECSSEGHGTDLLEGISFHHFGRRYGETLEAHASGDGQMQRFVALVPEEGMPRSGIIPGGELQSKLMFHERVFDNRSSETRGQREIESEVGLSGVDDVETVSSCSNCADDDGCHYDNSHEFARELNQEQYVDSGCLDTGSREGSFQLGDTWEDHRHDEDDVHYLSDLSKNPSPGEEANNVRETKEDEHIETFDVFEKVDLQVVEDRSKDEASSSETVDALSRLALEKSNLTGKAHSPDAQLVDEKDLTPDEGEVKGRWLLSKLMDDNKRLEGLLHDVMEWNKVQASAVLSLNQRIEHLEGNYKEAFP